MSVKETISLSAQVEIKDVFDPDNSNPHQVILDNLTSKPRSIFSKFFYDSRGSELFEEITDLPEYYIPGTEKKILRRIAPALKSELMGSDLIEIGSGGPEKIYVLLTSAFRDKPEINRYIPVDISKSALKNSAQKIKQDFDELEFYGLVADFLTQLHHLPANRKRFFCFFGSTIGNFPRKKQRSFLTSLSEEMNKGDSLLLGVDRVKDPDILESAYNDSRGITARFNRNILSVANKYADTDFPAADFDHLAFYNRDQYRIEMHLKPKYEVTVASPRISREIVIDESETIHTENSHKFTKKHVRVFASLDDLNLINVYSDAKDWFSLLYFKKQ